MFLIYPFNNYLYTLLYILVINLQSARRIRAERVALAIRLWFSQSKARKTSTLSSEPAVPLSRQRALHLLVSLSILSLSILSLLRISPTSTNRFLRVSIRLPLLWKSQ